MSRGSAWSESENKAVMKSVAKARSIDDAMALAKAAVPTRAHEITRNGLEIKLTRLGAPTLTQTVTKNQGSKWRK